MTQPFQLARFVRFVVGFAVKGPFFGWMAVWVAMLAVSLWSRDFSIEDGASLLDVAVGLGAALLASLGGAYVMGAIPATITGMACYPISRIMMSLWIWVTVSTLVGGIVAILSAWIISLSMPLDVASMMLTLLPGAAAGAVCGYQARRFRWAVLPSRST